MSKSKLYRIIIFVSILVLGCGVQAQDTIVQQQITLPPLFEYPTVPEEVEGWTERNNWLVENFWKDFDYKQESVGQIQLDHAFKTWSLPVRYAHRDVVIKSVKKMISSLNKNPTLLYQFTKAAESNLYSSEAEVWIDELYIAFLQPMVKHKKISEVRKARYKDQLTKLSNTLLGGSYPEFEYQTLSGEVVKFDNESKMTILEFGYPDCTECKLAKFALDSDPRIAQYVKEGKLLVSFIVPGEQDEMQADMMSGYSKNWKIGFSEDVEDIYDLRISPSIYLIGADGSIIEKNADINDVIAKVIDNIRQ